MNILLVTDSYPPEIRSASLLMQELSEELNLRSHRVTVITTWPEYNLDQDYDPSQISEKEIENGITVIRVKTLPHHNVNYLIRGISQLLMPFQLLFKICKYRIKPDAIVIYSPPLPLAIIGGWLKHDKIRVILNVQDLFPQNAIDLGILKNSLQIKFFRALENFAYHTAHIVTVHSKGNQLAVQQRYPNLTSKFKVLHNWVDIDKHEKGATKVDFRKEWGIRQKYVALFAGVMGPSQHLELLIRVAEEMQDEMELMFLMVGDGQEKKKLQKMAQEKSLSNVRFESFVSHEKYPDLLSICSIGLVCLSPMNTTPVVPGKFLGYMAFGLPVAAFLQANSDGHSIIKSAQCGFSVDSANKDACVQSMRDLFHKKDSFAKLGNNGKNYAINHFSKEACVTQLESMLENIVT